MSNENLKYQVYYDDECGLCSFFVEKIKKIDKYSNLFWNKNSCKQTNKISNKLLTRSIVVVEFDTNQLLIRHRAIEKIISVLPFGFLFSWILIIPGLEKIFGYIYDFISKNRLFITNLFNLPICEIHDRSSR